MSQIFRNKPNNLDKLELLGGLIACGVQHVVDSALESQDKIARVRNTFAQFCGTDDMTLSYIGSDNFCRLKSKTNPDQILFGTDVFTSSVSVSFEPLSRKNMPPLRLVGQTVWTRNQVPGESWQTGGFRLDGSPLRDASYLSPNVNLSSGRLATNEGNAFLDHVLEHWGPELFKLTSLKTKLFDILDSGTSSFTTNNCLDEEWTEEQIEHPSWDSFPMEIKSIKEDPQSAFQKFPRGRLG